MLCKGRIQLICTASAYDEPVREDAQCLEKVVSVLDLEAATPATLCLPAPAGILARMDALCRRVPEIRSFNHTARGSHQRSSLDRVEQHEVARGKWALLGPASG